MFNRLYEYPPIVTGYPLDDVFSVIMPEETTNLVTNPSFELDTTGYTALNSTIARVATWQRRGAWGLQITPNASAEAGVYFATVSLTAGQWYTFSVDFQGDAGKTYNLYFASTGAARLQTYSFIATGFKQRVYVKYYETSTTTRRLYLSRNSYADTNVFYTDGWQCENKAYPTTYCDGDQQGFVVGQAAYLWNGAAHASTSWRSGQTSSGGQMVKLRDLGFTLLAILGLGMTPLANIALPSSQGGSFYQNTIPASERDFSLVGAVQGDSTPDLQRLEKGLEDALQPDRVGAKQPVLLSYQPMDSCGNSAGEEFLIPCNYKTGLEGQMDNHFQMRLALEFQMFLPYIRSHGSEGASLSYKQSLANTTRIIKRDINALWSKLGTGTDNIIFTMAVGPDGYLYAGGLFGSAGGVGNTAYIARWTGSAWQPLGTGMDGAVYSIVFDPLGNLYAGGAFTNAGGGAAAYVAKWDGSTWSALGTGMSGGTPIVNALAIGLDGKLYAGGNFTTAGGGAAANIAVWNGSVWAALGAGTDDSVLALTIAPDGSLYAGGAFTTAGVATVNCIAKWNGAAWSALSTGMDDVVRALAIGKDSSLYTGGDFTTAGGITVNYVAKWNGASWEALGSGADIPTIYTLAMSENGMLYAGGSYITIGGLTPPESLAAWNGSAWVYVDLAMPPGAQTIYSLLENRGNLYVGFDPTVTAVTSATTSVTNTGSAEARPIFKFTGTGALYQLRNVTTGKTIYFNLTLLAGETVTLDLEKQTFTSNFRGNIRSTILPGSDMTFSLIKGTNVISLFIAGTTDGNTAASIQWTPKHHSIAGAVK